MRLGCYLIILISLCGGSKLRADIHEEAFNHIYDHAIWGWNKEGEPFSGRGSYAENLRPYMKLLQAFLKSGKIHSVADAGCGDWEFSRFMNWSGIDYRGYDVVASVVKKDQIRYGSDHIQFFHSNFLAEPLPPADLLICKHVLQHLSNEDIQRFIPQFKNFKYCLITNEVYPSSLSSDNPDIPVGSGRKVDLSQPPFNVKGSKILTFFIEDTAHQVFFINNSGDPKPPLVGIKLQTN